MRSKKKDSWRESGGGQESEAHQKKEASWTLSLWYLLNQVLVQWGQMYLPKRSNHQDLSFIFTVGQGLGRKTFSECGPLLHNYVLKGWEDFRPANYGGSPWNFETFCHRLSSCFSSGEKPTLLKLLLYMIYLWKIGAVSSSAFWRRFLNELKRFLEKRGLSTEGVKPEAEGKNPTSGKAIKSLLLLVLLSANSISEEEWNRITQLDLGILNYFAEESNKTRRRGPKPGNPKVPLKKALETWRSGKLAEGLVNELAKNPSKKGSCLPWVILYFFFREFGPPVLAQRQVHKLKRFLFSSERAQRRFPRTAKELGLAKASSKAAWRFHNRGFLPPEMLTKELAILFLLMAKEVRWPGNPLWEEESFGHLLALSGLFPRLMGRWRWRGDTLVFNFAGFDFPVREGRAEGPEIRVYRRELPRREDAETPLLAALEVFNGQHLTPHVRHYGEFTIQIVPGQGGKDQPIFTVRAEGDSSCQGPQDRLRKEVVLEAARHILYLLFLNQFSLLANDHPEWFKESRPQILRRPESLNSLVRRHLPHLPPPQPSSLEEFILVMKRLKEVAVSSYWQGAAHFLQWVVGSLANGLENLIKKRLGPEFSSSFFKREEIKNIS